jgi:hypothetical protein
VVVGIWKEMVDSDGMKIQAVKISGVSPQTEARLRKILEPAIGVPLWKTPVDQAALAAKQDPWVESVDVRRQFPHTLSVEVVERKPFAVVGSGAGDFKYVDESNVIIDRAVPQEIGQYPVLIGSSFDKNKDLRAQAIELLKSMPPEGTISRNDIGDVQFDDEHGFRFTVSGHGSKSGLLIDIGKENLPLHIDRARRVVQYLDDHGINASRVDSDYAKKVLVKVRKDR